MIIPVSDRRNSTDKLGRIASLQPLITSGQVRLSRRHILLVDQLRHFPMGAHDDGPDALEMAVAAVQPGLGAPCKVARIRNAPVTIFGVKTNVDLARGWFDQ